MAIVKYREELTMDLIEKGWTLNTLLRDGGLFAVVVFMKSLGPGSFFAGGVGRDTTLAAIELNQRTIAMAQSCTKKSQIKKQDFLKRQTDSRNNVEKKDPFLEGEKSLILKRRLEMINKKNMKG